LFPVRFLIDRVDEIPKQKYRIQFLDIEVKVGEHVPDPSTTRNPIILISVWDTFFEKYISFVWREDFKRKKEAKKKRTVHYFSNESDMLRTFFEFVRQTDPDIITGWNVDRFDMAYIINRADMLGLVFKKLSPLGRVSIRHGRDIIIGGRVVFDLLRAYRILNFNERRSYALDNVAKDELGIGKLREEGEDNRKVWMNITKNWRENVDQLIHYNLRDIKLCRELDEKKKIIDFFDERRRVAFCNFGQTFYNSMVIDSFMLKFCKGKYILPSKPEKRKRRFKGAMVLKPKKGLMKNVACFDVKSLYPSIIVSLNLSPEVIDEKGEIRVEDLRLKKGKGLIPSMFEKLFKLREKYKKLMSESDRDSVEYRTYDTKQYAVKVLANSIYGMMGYERFRLFEPRIAKAVTFVGRQIIKWMKDVAEKNGCEVVYGDTDSVFIMREDVKVGYYKKLKEIFNKSFSEFAKQFGVEKHIFKVEFEKLFRVILFGKAMKRYAGHIVVEHGKSVDRLLIRGFETRRSDSSEFAENLQRTVFKMILQEGKSKEEVIKYIRSESKKMKNGKYNLEYIGLPKGINKPLGKYKANTPWVRGCLYANKYLKMNFGKGSKPKLVWLKSTGSYPDTDVICYDYDFQIPKEFEIDWEKMEMENVVMKLSRIFTSLGWSTVELQGQTTLADW
ncbi:MAG: DNA polymerase domain-containing protein, partial [Methanosarcinales archaeon]